VGWKRATERYGRLWGVGLSENQCGMETKQKRMTFFDVMLSENQCGMETKENRLESGNSRGG
jgi:hypothetical protein